MTKECDKQGKEHWGIDGFAAACENLNDIVEVDLSFQSAEWAETEL